MTANPHFGKTAPMSGKRESDLYDEVTYLFLGVPAATAVPVLVEAAIHAINCLEPGLREEALQVAIAVLTDNVDLSCPAVYGAAQ